MYLPAFVRGQSQFKASAGSVTVTSLPRQIDKQVSSSDSARFTLTWIAIRQMLVNGEIHPLLRNLRSGNRMVCANGCVVVQPHLRINQ